MKSTLKCYGCKETFRREELLSYTPINAKISHNYCPKCYEEKLAREKFSQTVCKIFGLKAPGPRIWAERERLRNTYGYTDETICDCLQYVYEVNKTKKLSESLCLVTPTNVEKMMKMKRNQEFKKNAIDEAMRTEYNVKYIDVRENEDDEEIVLEDPNDFLYDF